MPVGRTIQPNELSAFSSEIPGLEEKRRWALYDRIVYAAAATLSGDQSLFSTPIGQGTTAKTLLDTNLRQSGVLPARQGLEIWDIRIQPQLTVVASDVSAVSVDALATAFNSIIYGGSFVFRQSQKVDLELAPLAILCAGYGASGVTWGSANITAAATAGAGSMIFSNGIQGKSSLWDLDPLPIIILPQRSFSVTINFPTAITLPTGVGLNLWCHLDGILHRSA